MASAAAVITLFYFPACDRVILFFKEMFRVYDADRNAGEPLADLEASLPEDQSVDLDFGPTNSDSFFLIKSNLLSFLKETPFRAPSCISLSILDLSVLEQGAAHAEAASRGGAVGDVATRNGFAIDRKGGVGAEWRRVVRALGRRGHDARESGSDESLRSRRGVAQSQVTASRVGARQTGPAEGADGLAGAADVGREAVFGAAVVRGGRAGNAVCDDELEPGDHGVFAEDDLVRRSLMVKKRQW